LGMADKRLKTSVGHAVATTSTGRPKAVGETIGKDDIEPQDFRERQGHKRLWGGYIFAFCSLFNCSTAERSCQAY
jgi:hypothetical protein